MKSCKQASSCIMILVIGLVFSCLMVVLAVELAPVVVTGEAGQTTFIQAITVIIASVAVAWVGFMMRYACST